MIETAYAAGASGLPQFEVEHFPSQLFWAVVSFVILLLLFRRYVIPKLNRILDERAAVVRDDLDAAEAARKQGEALLAEYEAQLAGIREQAERMISEAHDRAVEERRAVLEEIDAMARRKKQRFREELKFARAKAMDEIRDAAVDIAMDAAERILRRAMTRSEVEASVDEAIEVFRERTKSGL